MLPVSCCSHWLQPCQVLQPLGAALSVVAATGCSPDSNSGHLSHSLTMLLKMAICCRHDVLLSCVNGHDCPAELDDSWSVLHMQGSDIIQAHNPGRRLLRSAMLHIGEDPFGPGPRSLRLAHPNSRGKSRMTPECRRQAILEFVAGNKMCRIRGW